MVDSLSWTSVAKHRTLPVETSRDPASASAEHLGESVTVPPGSSGLTHVCYLSVPCVARCVALIRFPAPEASTQET